MPKFKVSKKNLFFELKFSLQFLSSNEFFCLKKFVTQILILIDFNFSYMLDYMRITKCSYAEMLSLVFDYLGSFGLLQRYKGLGEMNPEQLWETVMDPLKRTLHLITINDRDENMFIVDTLMGTNVRRRKFFIESMMTSFDF